MLFVPFNAVSTLVVVVFYVPLAVFLLVFF